MGDNDVQGLACRMLSRLVVVQVEVVGLGDLFGKGGFWVYFVVALGLQKEGYFRGFLQVGFWVTVRVVEFCFRFQVYLWRYRWVGFR